MVCRYIAYMHKLVGENSYHMPRMKVACEQFLGLKINCAIFGVLSVKTNQSCQTFESRLTTLFNNIG